VSIWEKAALAVLHQRYWADNQVSVTLTFKPEEEDQIGAVLRAFDGQLKSVSMLPLLEGGAYRQMPYERISEETREQMVAAIKPMDWDRLYAGESWDSEGEKFCSNDTCELPVR
jgi:ribonucleoside-triphosphate reductase